MEGGTSRRKKRPMHDPPQSGGRLGWTAVGSCVATTVRNNCWDGPGAPNICWDGPGAANISWESPPQTYPNLAQRGLDFGVSVRLYNQYYKYKCVLFIKTYN